MSYPTNNYPTSIQTTTDPVASNNTAAFDHAGMEKFQNDSIEALKTKVGINGSTNQDSVDYKLSEVTGADKAVGVSATQSLTNKTLQSPTIVNPVINLASNAAGDIYYRGPSNTLTRLPAGTSGQFLQQGASNAPQWTTIPASASAEQVQNNSFVYAATSTGNDSYAITVSPAPTAYVAGQKFIFRSDVANTGVATLNVNGLGAIDIRKNGLQALQTGDIVVDQIVEVVYNGAVFQMVSPSSRPVHYASGTTTKNAADASGTQNIAHGLGRIPSYVRIRAICDLPDGSGDRHSREANTVFNGTTQSSLSYYQSNGQNTVIDTSFTLNINTFSSTTQTGIVTFDATNIIITWTRTGSPTGTYTLLWEAFS